MMLKSQKRIAGSIAKRSKNNITFDPERLDEIKESITRADIRKLISVGSIRVNPITGVSRGRARKIAIQKRKGKRKGMGSRKGTAGVRRGKKRIWINNVRKQRLFLKTLREIGRLEKKDYRQLYQKVKGGFFRSKRHLQLYINENNLIKK